MSPEETIQTLHPDPAKKGVNISKKKYDLLYQAIISILTEKGEMTFSDLMNAVESRLQGSFEGSISWYYVSVKLDLEARRVIVRLPGNGPQRIRLEKK